MDLRNINWVKQKTSERWNPVKENDSLIGKIIELRSTDFGNVFKVVGDFEENAIKQSGEVLTPAHKVLVELLKNASVGNYVHIKYLGSKRSKHPNDVELYEVSLGFEKEVK